MLSPLGPPVIGRHELTVVRRIERIEGHIRIGVPRRHSAAYSIDGLGELGESIRWVRAPECRCGPLR